MFAVRGWSVVFIAVISIFPVPVASNPIAVLSFVQEKVVVPPVTIVENSIVKFSSLQTTWSSTGFTCAWGFTVTV